MTPYWKTRRKKLGAVASREVTLFSLSEDDMQAKIIAPFLDLCVATGVLAAWWHIPNGGSRHPTEAGKLRRMGVLAGVPDLMLVFRHREPWPLVAMVELKTMRGRVDVEQTELIDRLIKAGLPCGVVRSVEALRFFMAERLQIWGQTELLAKLPGVT